MKFRPNWTILKTMEWMQFLKTKIKEKFRCRIFRKKNNYSVFIISGRISRVRVGSFILSIYFSSSTTGTSTRLITACATWDSLRIIYCKWGSCRFRRIKCWLQISDLEYSRYYFSNCKFLNLEYSRYFFFLPTFWNLECSRYYFLNCNFLNLEYSRYYFLHCKFLNLIFFFTL